VKVNSEMPTGEILPEFMCPGETYFPSQIAGLNEVWMAGIKKRLTADSSTMGEMI
jgi:hypothetical protein